MTEAENNRYEKKKNTIKIIISSMISKGEDYNALQTNMIPTWKE